MLSLARYFDRGSFKLATFFLGKITPQDMISIQTSGLNVTFFESERPPEAFLSRMRWYADATRHQLQKWMSRGKPQAQQNQGDSQQPPEPLKLDDYKWPWAQEQFRQMVDRFRPQVVIAQYITMAYLIQGLSPLERRGIHTVLDTHDILHERGMQFDAAGYLHWLQVDEREEAATWNQFDTVLAIQQNEAELIRSLAPHPRVMVVGHSPELGQPQVSDSRHEGGAIRIGYIGSANYSNWHAINRFLIEVWPDLVTHEMIDAELVIAGKICSWFEMQESRKVESLRENRIRLLGEVDSLGDFYRQIDIAMNPVQFGTGLKIKNVEALAYGKPLVTTESGASGMSDSARDACCVVNGFPQMVRELEELCLNSARRDQMSKDALLLAKNELSDEATYSELARHLSKVAQALPNTCQPT
jgi:glycosyltransferase involved in cell wall biosynthesis